MSCTAADSEGNAKTHSLKEQFAPPHSQHEAPYVAGYREKYHWSPRKVTREDKQTEHHEEAESELKVKDALQKVEERILEGGRDKVDGNRLEERGSFIPALRKAPLVVQIFALLQLSISLAALGGQYCAVVLLFMQFFEEWSFLSIHISLLLLYSERHPGIENIVPKSWSQRCLAHGERSSLHPHLPPARVRGSHTPAPAPVKTSSA